jgi:hypothetical protein
MIAAQQLSLVRPSCGDIQVVDEEGRHIDQTAGAGAQLPVDRRDRIVREVKEQFVEPDVAMADRLGRAAYPDDHILHPSRQGRTGGVGGGGNAVPIPLKEVRPCVAKEHSP